MKKLLLLLLLITTSIGCAEREPLQDACSQIEGVWSCETDDQWGKQKSYIYNFSDGLCIVWDFDGGNLLSEHRYAYDCEMDTMHLLNIATHGKQTAHIVFADERTCYLNLIGWPTITLNRIP